MTIITTPSELMDKWLWEDYCEIDGINVWAVNEGLMDSNEKIYLSEETSIKLGFIKTN